MKRRERVSSFLIVEAGLILLNILCYGDIRWLLLEQILLFPCFNVLKRKKREKEKHLYEKGFQNLLQSMMTSLQAGYSLNNSCRIALKELEELYQDQNNPMLRQMRRIIQGLDLHITLEQLFMEFAESTGLEEAKQFAVVIEIVRSTGGNMVEILKRTMQHTVDGYPFEITYELAEDGYIRLDGSINEEEQAKLKRGETYRTYIVVTARYGEYRKSKKYEIRIVPKKNISQTNVFYKIQQYLKKEEQENRYSRDIKIPSVYKDIEITKRQENQGGISGILILFVTVCIFIPLHNYLKLQEEGKKCQEQAERDFPVIVHLLTLYMGAGLSFFSAVKRISQNYQKQRELDDSKKYAFEKMMRMEQQMSNGVSQREACQDWGMQFRTDSYQKLSLILIQSFTKGGREAAMLMEAEEREAFHKRIDRAKKEGEEASTRLLFPMILLLCQVMLLVMYPALTRFQGF